MSTADSVGIGTGLGGQAAAPIRVRPIPGWRAIDFAELWQYRELLWILGTRDVKVRYKQTVLGVLWAIIPPLFTALIFNGIFRLLGVAPATLSNGFPYLLFAFTAQVPWQLFASSLNQSSNSLVGSQHLLTKVYFPRLVIPIASLFSAVVDFLVCLAILACMMAWYRESIALGWPLVSLPFFTLLALATSLAVGLWMSALNVKYRDVRFALPFLIQLWIFVSSVILPSSSLPEKLRWALLLNPMSAIIEGYRSALFGLPFDWPALGIAALLTILMLFYSVYSFGKAERSFADII